MKSKRDELRKKGFCSQNDTDMHNFRHKRCLLKSQSVLRKLSFTELLYVKKNAKIVRKTIHHILKPNSNALTTSPDD